MAGRCKSIEASGEAMNDSIRFGDLVGEVHHDPEAIGAFLRWWFRKGDLVNATFIREGKRKKVCLLYTSDAADE